MCAARVRLLSSPQARHGGGGGARGGGIGGGVRGACPVHFEAGAVGVLCGGDFGELAEQGDPGVELSVVEDAEAVLAAAVVACRTGDSKKDDNPRDF